VSNSAKMNNCWLFWSFHSQHCDINWLEERLKIHMERKLEQDRQASEVRFRRVDKINSSVVYRELGRSHTAASLFLYDSDIAREAYMDCFGMKSQTLQGDLISLSLHESIAMFAYNLMEALRKETHNKRTLYKEVLQMFEIAHIISFCKKEYLTSDNTQLNWIVDYIHDIGKTFEAKRHTFYDSLQNNGHQIKTILYKVISLVDSCVFNPSMSMNFTDRNEINCRKVVTFVADHGKTVRGLIATKKFKMSVDK
jgi:hypothetical protein